MTPDVSLVVVCYEMEREIARTLASLSPAYQRNCPPGRCEVILVDNGSRRPPRAEMFAHLGLDLQVHVFPNPTHSPVAALNFGIAQARAPLVCAWIDGARLASPGLVDACIAASRLHPRPVIATSNYQLGPGPQYITMQQGYDARAEDALLEQIDWPADGYRLFDISVPIWKAEALAPVMESNALFLTRVMWDELGGFDPGFESAGGGACNPDVFIRACGLPDAQLIRILGEATFHQIHGGLATNAGDRMFEVLKAISREYYQLRGRPMRPVNVRGWLFDPSIGGLV